MYLISFSLQMIPLFFILTDLRCKIDAVNEELEEVSNWFKAGFRQTNYQ